MRTSPNVLLERSEKTQTCWQEIAKASSAPNRHAAGFHAFAAFREPDRFPLSPFAPVKALGRIDRP
jgi:hypothetical protein